MVFPVESEDRTMRNLLMLCQDHARLIVEAYRKILALTDILVKEQNETGGHIEDIRNIMNETVTIKESLIKELHDIGGVLITREDFYRLNSKFGDIMDHINAIGLRIDAMREKKLNVPESAREGLLKITEIAFDALLKLREGIMSMGFNSEKAIAFTREIDDLERKIDTLFVEVEISIITSSAEIPTIMILKDIVSIIENMVDMVRDASDLIRIIAL
jgi:uncharacterized protein Yka (UPF0111/DUF47 family)